MKELPSVTNQLILELLTFKDATPNCSYKMFYHCLQMFYGSRWPHEALAAFTKSTERLKAQYYKLKKKREKEMELSNFLQEDYVLPKLGICRGKVQQFTPPKPPPAVTQSSQKIEDLRKKLYSVTRNSIKATRSNYS